LRARTAGRNIRRLAAPAPAAAPEPEPQARHEPQDDAASRAATGWWAKKIMQLKIFDS